MRPQEQKAVVVMTEDERRLEADWNRERQRLEGEIESLAVKIEAEAKMRLGAHRLRGIDWALLAWRSVVWLETRRMPGFPPCLSQAWRSTSESSRTRCTSCSAGAACAARSLRSDGCSGRG